jgi:4-amino-4-deoxy-L-arabinose transferase-like glycosyltransferase
VTEPAPPPEPLVPEGNAFRPKSALFAALSAAVPFLLMTANIHSPLSVPLGLLGCLLAGFFLLDFLGTFDDAGEGEAVTLRAITPRLVELAGSATLLVAAMRLAVAGRLPFATYSSGLLVCGGFLWVVVAGYRVLEGLGAVDAQRPLLKRPGFLLTCIGAGLYLPMLGSFSLTDPWETHYGEVAREMLSRDDWITTFWAQEGFFWSKPVLDFWLQALSFSAFGVEFRPDRMLGAGVSAGLTPRPEWAARLPITLLTLLSVWLIYRAVRKSVGERPAFLGGLVLLTLPYWYLLARQSMTDMPYVAPLTAALALVFLGIESDPNARVRVFPISIGRRTFGLSAYHALFLLVIATVLPQVLYLASRHLTLELLQPPRGFSVHWDGVLFGSPGNCGLPGNDACRFVPPAEPAFQPIAGALLWSVILGFFLWLNRGERRVQRLLFLAAWYFTALAALAKGAPGLVLPLVVAVAHLLVTGRARDLARLELPALGLLVLAVCLPWYVQMYARHGTPFTDRLLFHDMYKRAFVHVHDTNTGDDVSFRYYVWQLGYGLFPWTGLAAAGLVHSAQTGRRDVENGSTSRAEMQSGLLLWFVLAFAMFTVSLTKFHHYILPAVPPLAMLSGLVLDRTLPERELGLRATFAWTGYAALAALFMLYGSVRLLEGSLLGSAVPDLTMPHATGVASLLVGVALFVLGLRRFGIRRPPLASDADRFASAAISVVALASAAVLVLVARDLSTRGEVDGSARFIHLISYNYERAWPDTLDFDAAFRSIGFVSAAACLLIAVRALRAHGAMLLVCTGVWAAIFGLDVYFVRIAPHWGQRETVLAYYQARKDATERLVAYQMNWKGENFYTGNHMPAFVSTGQRFKSWLAEEKRRGVRVLFFTTEHSREGSLKRELGTVKKYERITSRALNNKFFVARVEL